MQITPGPWIGFIADGSFDILAAGRPGTIAVCPKGDGHDADANSRLIAAAPDMLALLEDIAAGDAFGSVWREQAQNVVAKATGKTE